MKQIKTISDILSEYTLGRQFSRLDIENAMKEYGLQEYNRGIEDGKIIAEHGTTMYIE